MKDNKCRGGFRFTKVSCGPQLPIINEGSAPSPISTTKYWLSLGSVPILNRREGKQVKDESTYFSMTPISIITLIQLFSKSAIISGIACKDV